ncbi:hypothetical protein BU25DRAFT_331135 [Macroventuria anomochaeta]|uniref:Uncharacterized protein n=1 Tax=Macroventuria anomochaeta TaxID=301207 RepID=A0ACB6SFF7_9PLEO|nr:uncharacterized protein BU25DRAFT_331135 [Macroventuria anomochaeta]KAF2632063.1 hypothetical protein BU25DRAFT_331135 [Macroventuria anomochaeta]
MPDLPIDVQLLILEHVTSKADLKALCLTCKGVRAVAVPLLYHTVYLRTWDRDGTSRFVRSVAAGADLYLQHTRSLIFEDEMSRT